MSMLVSTIQCNILRLMCCRVGWIGTETMQMIKLEIRDEQSN